MRVLYKLPQVVAEKVDEAWTTGIETTGLNLLPEWVIEGANQTFNTLVNDLMAHHYLYNYELEEWLMHTDLEHYPNMHSEIVADKGGCDKITALYDSLQWCACLEDPTIVTTMQRKLSLWNDLPERTPLTEYCEEDIVDVLHTLTLEMTVDMLREIDVIANLPVIDDELSLTRAYDDIRIDARKRTLIVYKLR